MYILYPNLFAVIFFVITVLSGCINESEQTIDEGTEES